MNAPLDLIHLLDDIAETCRIDNELSRLADAKHEAECALQQSTNRLRDVAYRLARVSKLSPEFATLDTALRQARQATERAQSRHLRAVGRYQRYREHIWRPHFEGDEVMQRGAQACERQAAAIDRTPAGHTVYWGN